jgi:biopolymer transport protein ExbB/TolQ
MFYAFYDVNRSIESINALFDGLGIAVGTTVVGLIVAILAMVFYTTLKYRLVRTISLVENEALELFPLIEQRGVKE